MGTNAPENQTIRQVRAIKDVNLADFGDMSEILITFDMFRSVVGEKKKEYISIVITSNEKCGLTVVLAVMANESKCPSIIIFKRQSFKKIFFFWNCDEGQYHRMDGKKNDDRMG